MSRRIIHSQLIIWLILGAATSAAAPTQSASTPAGAAKQGETPDRMIISGERDGPLGMRVIPWQDPATVLPDALLQAQLPERIDATHSLADDPVNRRVPAAEVAKPSAPVAAKAVQKKRRGQPRDEPPPAMIMQSPSRP